MFARKRTAPEPFTVTQQLGRELKPVFRFYRVMGGDYVLGYVRATSDEIACMLAEAKWPGVDLELSNMHKRR